MRAPMPTPNNAAVNSLLESAFRHIQCGEIEQARQSFERAAQLRPDEPDIELGVGNCLAMLGRLGPTARRGFTHATSIIARFHA